MITKDEIRTTLSDIRFYYANIKSFQNASKYVGENKIVKTAEKFNIAIENCIFTYTQTTERWRLLPPN